MSTIAQECETYKSYLESIYSHADNYIYMSHTTGSPRKVYTPTEEDMVPLTKKNMANISELLSVMRTLDRQPVDQAQRVDPTEHDLTQHTNNYKYWLQKAWDELVLYLGTDPGCDHNLANLKDQIIANVR